MERLATCTGQEARAEARAKTLTVPTTGVAKGYIQANMLVLPSKYADDFRRLCHRNPVPCPLLAESSSVGSFSEMISCVRGISDSTMVAPGLDVRQDIPRYMVYRNGVLEKFQTTDILEEWTDDHVAFLIGCSYSFETDLTQAKLTPRQILQGRNVPMYRTTLQLCPSGVFTGSTYVVSMRPYKRREVEAVRSITRRFNATHGEPIAWGWDAVSQLGISDIDKPEWGDAPLTLSGEPLSTLRGQQSDGGEDNEEIPVFWGCGVTPQEAVMKAKIPGVVMAHAPGHMLILDITDETIVG